MKKVKEKSLYTSTLSANGRKPVAVSIQLDLLIPIKEINVYQGDGQKQEYLNINPFGKIPTLTIGNFTLWESNAIILYLAEQDKAGELTSTDSLVRADIARWMFWESSHWQPAISSILEGHVGHRLLPEAFPKPANKANWDEETFRKCIDYLEKHLQGKTHLVNNKLSIADFSVAGMMTYFRFCDFPFDEFPNIKKWYENIETLDAWQRSSNPLWEDI